MNPREIIAEAWTITKRERSLRRWGFFSALLETLLNVKLFSYQIYFFYEYLQGRDFGFFDIEIILFRSIPFGIFLTIIVTFIVMVVIEFFFPHLAAGAIIGLAAKSYRKEEVRGGAVLAIYNFFPVFAIHELFVLGSLSLVITSCSLILRYVEGSIKVPIIIVLIILFVLSNFFRFFASFAEEAVVIRKAGIFSAIGKSTKLILSYLSHVMFLLILLIVISLRIFANTLMLFLFPGFVIGVGFLLSTFLPTILSAAIGAIVGILLLLLFAKLLAYLHVFRQTVWTITYLELSERKELDVIVDLAAKEGGD